VQVSFVEQKFYNPDRFSWAFFLSSRSLSGERDIAPSAYTMLKLSYPGAVLGREQNRNPTSLLLRGRRRIAPPEDGGGE
jgi:hypothetical protein